MDAFHALARSSPWRWRSLHFTSRSDDSPRRRGHGSSGPAGCAPRAQGEEDRVEQFGPRPSMTHYFSDDPGFVPPPPRTPRWAMDVVPTYRPDGLVADRPQGPSCVRRPAPRRVHLGRDARPRGAQPSRLGDEDLDATRPGRCWHATYELDGSGRETWWATVRALEATCGTAASVRRVDVPAGCCEPCSSAARLDCRDREHVVGARRGRPASSCRCGRWTATPRNWFDREPRSSPSTTTWRCPPSGADRLARRVALEVRRDQTAQRRQVVAALLDGDRRQPESRRAGGRPRGSRPR